MYLDLFGNFPSNQFLIGSADLLKLKGFFCELTDSVKTFIREYFSESGGNLRSKQKERERESACVGQYLEHSGGKLDTMTTAYHVDHLSHWALRAVCHQLLSFALDLDRKLFGT